MWAVHFPDGAGRIRLFREFVALLKFLTSLSKDNVVEVRHTGQQWLYLDGWAIPEAGEPAPVGCLDASGQPSSPGLGYGPGWGLGVLARFVLTALLFALLLPLLWATHAARPIGEPHGPPPIPLPFDPDKQSIFLNAPNA